MLGSEPTSSDSSQKAAFEIVPADATPENAKVCTRRPLGAVTAGSPSGNTPYEALNP